MLNVLTEETKDFINIEGFKTSTKSILKVPKFETWVRQLNEWGESKVCATNYLPD